MSKKIYFRNKQGHRIVGLFNLPKSKGHFPVVIICHGFKGYKEQMHLQSLATALAKEGIAVFRFDFTHGVGESDGKLEDITFTQYLRDLKAVIDYIVVQKFIDNKRIGLVGHSLGGQLILTYAPKDKRIKTIVDLAGPTYRGKGDTNLEKNIIDQLEEAKSTGYYWIKSSRTKKKYKINIRYYFDILKYNTPKLIKKIMVPTLILHGSNDKTVPLNHSRYAYESLRCVKKLEIIKGAPHTWRGKDDPKGKYRNIINKIVVSWFKKYL